MREEQLPKEMRRNAKLLRRSVRLLLRKAFQLMRSGELPVPLVKRAAHLYSLAQHFEDAADRITVLSQAGG